MSEKNKNSKTENGAADSKKQLVYSVQSWLGFGISIFFFLILIFTPIYFYDTIENSFYSADYRTEQTSSNKTDEIGEENKITKIGSEKTNNDSKHLDIKSANLKFYIITLLWSVCFIVFIFSTILTVYSYNSDILRFKYQDEKENFNNFSSIRKTIYDIDKSILRYNMVGIIALLITIIAMVVLVSFVFYLFQSAASQIGQVTGLKDTMTVTLVIIIYILRTSLLGTLIITFLVYSFKFTNASFDQATRFNKRKHASLFLLEIVNSFNGMEPNNIEKIMLAFKEWNVNVESAYTDSDFNSKIAIKALERLDKNEENNNVLVRTLFDLIKTEKK